MEEQFTESHRNVDVHLHVHIEGPITVNLNVTQMQPPPRRAVAGKLTQVITGDGKLAGQVTVDTGGKVELQFVDDKGDTDALAPLGNGTGLVFSFSSDTPAVATVAQSGSNPLEGDVTGVAEGIANIGATVLNTDGSPVLEPDGVTPFTFAAIPVTVDAGLAVSGALIQE